MIAPGPDLRNAWADLLRRRPALADPLGVYGDLVEAWAAAEIELDPLPWTPEECAARWARGIPLLAEARPPLASPVVEDLLSGAMELVTRVRPEAVEGLRRFAAAWDRGAITPAALLPARGRLGRVDEEIGLEADLVAFLALGCLRPALGAYFAEAGAHLRDGQWTLGVCPLCGAPPGFADIREDGQRALACHLCGHGWTFSRLRCPFCGTDEAKSLGRLEPDATEEGYLVATCTACRAYLKELDRRVRWNGGPPLVEDWGSPHFDVAAERAGYWRPARPLILTARAATG